jgi:hypothetical protein
MKFARIIDLDENTQVLVTRSYDEDEEDGPFLVTVRTDVGGMESSIKAGFMDEDKANYMFDTYGESNAREFYASMVKLLIGDDE